MTNVMAYFAARSLRGSHNPPAEDGTAVPALRPRLPSRYEGAEASTASDIAREDAFVEWGREPLPAASVPEPPALPQPGASGTPPPPQAVPRDGETSRREAPPPEPAHLPVPPDRERGSDHVAAAPPEPAAAAEITEAVSPVAPQRPAPMAVPPRLPEDPRHGALARQERPPTIAVEADHARRPAPEHVPAERVASRQPLPQASAPVAAPLRAGLAFPVVPAMPRPADTPQTPPRQRERVAEKAPARVQVTIGRIEIRAASAPAQPRIPPRPPSMSLDDYLAKRGQG
jgi:nicotinate-nucleotide--dimethylbenzimidazole phosphoribosyltransferase